MARRPLVFVLGLTLGDYLLWNWSLNSNHDIIALASGLTLPPLALVSAWLLALGCARILGALTQRRSALRDAAMRRRASRRAASRSDRLAPGESPVSATGTEAASRKLAA